jgi:hypothetical protein
MDDVLLGILKEPTASIEGPRAKRRQSICEIARTESNQRFGGTTIVCVIARTESIEGDVGDRLLRRICTTIQGTWEKW